MSKKMCFKKPTLLTTIIASLIIALGLSTSLHAAQVTQPIEGTKLQAQASYLMGDKNKPAVLILHGFLTTNRFHTVVSMAEGMHSEDYTVLSPTLTLGINKRKGSIKCGSIHTHTLEKDILEVKDWVDWLYQQGHKDIILLGHSSGSLELLEYMLTYNDERVKSVIFTSAFYLNGAELGIIDKEIEIAQKLAKTPQKKPHKYNFLFCKNNYFATPESYLSYLKLTRNYVIKGISSLTVPSHTIMGQADKRYQSVGQNWLEELESTGTNLIVVEGANHFFSSEHEFDLQDQINNILNGLKL